MKVARFRDSPESQMGKNIFDGSLVATVPGNRADFQGRVPGPYQDRSEQASTETCAASGGWHQSQTPRAPAGRKISGQHYLAPVWAEPLRTFARPGRPDKQWGKRVNWGEGSGRGGLARMNRREEERYRSLVFVPDVVGPTFFAFAAHAELSSPSLERGRFDLTCLTAGGEGNTARSQCKRRNGQGREAANETNKREPQNGEGSCRKASRAETPLFLGRKIPFYSPDVHMHENQAAEGKG